MNDEIRILVKIARDTMVKAIHGYVEDGRAEGRMWKRGLCTFMELEVDTHAKDIAEKYECMLTFEEWAHIVRLLKGWMCEWEDSTKNDTYPVPPPHSFEQCEHDAYMGKTQENSYFMACLRGETGHNMYEGEYGESRLELARFIYNKCEEFLNQKD